MTQYYAFLNDDDICYTVAYQEYEPIEGVKPYEYFDYSSTNNSCIPLPDTIETYEEATATYCMKQYNRDTETWSKILPESKNDDVSEYDSMSVFPLVRL